MDEAKEMIMRAHGHAPVWGTHTGIGRATGGKGPYQQLKAWWVAHKTARDDAKLATLTARWDGRREAVTPDRAEAASEMAAAHHGIAVATMLYGLSQ
jgi:hypothetical protein